MAKDAELRDFLQSIGTDHFKLQELRDDPDRVLESADLDDEHRQILRSGDALAIHHLVTSAMFSGGPIRVGRPGPPGPPGRPGPPGTTVVVVVVVAVV